MKKLIIVFLVLHFVTNAYAQRYESSPGIEKFQGSWQYIAGQDTIRMTCIVKYSGNENVQTRGCICFYTYKQGNNIVWNNSFNYSQDEKADFAGVKVFGVNNDSLIVIGTDKPKRRRNDGYLILKNNYTQLKWVRDIEAAGGGLWMYGPGEEPLPGYTLPDIILFEKYLLPSEEKQPGQ